MQTVSVRPGRNTRPGGAAGGYVPAVTGIWMAVAGAVAALAGLSGSRRIRRLRATGLTAWAVAVPRPVSADRRRGRAGRVPFQYELADRRVLERVVFVTGKTAASLRAGEKVLLWYDPGDPQDVLVSGREGRISDTVLVIAGMLFILAGAGIAVFTA